MSDVRDERGTRGLTAFLVLAAAVFALLDVALNASVQRTSGALGPYAGLVLSLVADASLPFLPRFPRQVALLAGFLAVLAAVGDAVQPGLFTPEDPVRPVAVPLCTPVIVWFIVQWLPRREGLTTVAVLAVAAARPWDPEWDAGYAGLTATVLPAALALYVRARRELEASLRARAEGAERERRLLAERAKAEERQRLASEMHDIVTHHATEIVLTAGALSVSTRDPEARTAAERIRGTGTRVLDELRDLIGILRRGEPPEAGHEGGAVTLTADELNGLLDAATEAGNPARLHVDGEPGTVTPVIARGVHRVLQEALTNARKHAPGSPVDVELRHGPRDLTITVTNLPDTRQPAAGTADPGRSLVASGSGIGLDGLRRRVSLLGGTFTAGPTPGGGFRVSAVLPASVPTDPESALVRGTEREAP